MLHLLRGPYEPEVFEQAARRIREVRPHAVYLELPADSIVKRALEEAERGNFEPVMRELEKKGSKYLPVLKSAHEVGARLVPIDSTYFRPIMRREEIELMGVLYNPYLGERPKAEELLKHMRTRVLAHAARLKHMQLHIEEHYGELSRQHAAPLAMAIVGTDNKIESEKVPITDEQLAPRKSGGHPIVQGEDMLREGKPDSDVIDFLQEKIRSKEIFKT